VGGRQKVEEGKQGERVGKMGGGDREKGEEWDKVKVYMVQAPAQLFTACSTE